MGDLASSEAASYPFNKEDPMYKLWNGVVHKKAAYVWKLLSLGLDVLVCAPTPAVFSKMSVCCPTLSPLISLYIDMCEMVKKLCHGQVTDVDIVFLKDPLPLFSNKTIDLFFIDDTKSKTDDGQPPSLCGGRHASPQHPHTHTRLASLTQSLLVNDDVAWWCLSGFWLGRSNDHTLAFVASVLECEQKGSKEQPCFNKWYQDIAKRGSQVYCTHKRHTPTTRH